MRDSLAKERIQSLENASSLRSYVARLSEWFAEQDESRSPALQMAHEDHTTDLLQTTGIIDRKDVAGFKSLVEDEAFSRVTLYELLHDSGLSRELHLPPTDELPAISPEDDVPWLTLVLAAFAWRNQYPISQLDSKKPPSVDSPAGQTLNRAAHFIRRQISRSSTQSELWANRLQPIPSAESHTIESLPDAEEVQPPLPPHYRVPIPERYPEVSSETIHVNPDEPEEQPLTVGDPIVVTSEDIVAADEDRETVSRMPSISLPPENIPSEPPSPLPRQAVVMPDSSTHSRPALTMAIRNMIRPEELATTKLKVLVEEYPDGPGMYGLQVRVSCKGIKSHVAGTTNRSGQFTCELPVRVRTGLTYDVEVTWPNREDRTIEKKSITLNADRTVFQLPFYWHYATQGPGEEG